MIDTLPPNEERARVYGSDDEVEPTEEDEALYRQFAEFVGEDPIEVTEGSR